MSRKLDPDIKALRAIVRALCALKTYEERSRVIAYIRGRFKL